MTFLGYVKNVREGDTALLGEPSNKIVVRAPRNTVHEMKTWLQDEIRYTTAGGFYKFQPMLELSVLDDDMLTAFIDAPEHTLIVGIFQHGNNVAGDLHLCVKLMGD